ncbi:hypothetical protein [Pseudothauera nasutitermitis]|uniref:hypothetical protein n=1 Tax=Pseudothauera nasutitermitis TaxID=2565930 RepID=UPI001E4C3111|nr:hypothetical protein [Pseudothauera nasutitermitis]
MIGTVMRGKVTTLLKTLMGLASATGPRLLILDEPTEGIRLPSSRTSNARLRSLAETGGMAILLVEQYYDLARSLADHYLVMERGEIVMRGAGKDMDAGWEAGALVV